MILQDLFPVLEDTHGATLLLRAIWFHVTTSAHPTLHEQLEKTIYEKKSHRYMATIPPFSAVQKSAEHVKREMQNLRFSERIQGRMQSNQLFIYG